MKKPARLRLSTKQQEILRVVLQRNTDGSFIDLDELLERLSYKPTKQALQFSIRTLISHGLIERRSREVRRGASRRVLAPTLSAYNVMRGLI